MELMHARLQSYKARPDNANDNKGGLHRRRRKTYGGGDASYAQLPQVSRSPVLIPRLRIQQASYLLTDTRPTVLQAAEKWVSHTDFAASFSNDRGNR